MNKSPFYKQADFLLRILPYIASHKEFAIKGGTAINFFVRDVPRLSVDIDLTYLPVSDREEAIGEISKSLGEIASRVKENHEDIEVIPRYYPNSKDVIGLILRSQQSTIKIEPNLVIRGSVFAPEERELHSAAQNLFERYVVAQTLSFADLYGSKICAALDRQHPRDLFDVYILFENEGITEAIRKAFLVYLISHNRPIIEVLNPNRIDLRDIFQKEFIGMTIKPVSLETLVEVRERLIYEIQEALTEGERRFLVSVKQLEPDWDLLGIENVEHLPGVKWKLINLAKMKKDKHKRAVEKLRSFLGV